MSTGDKGGKTLDGTRPKSDGKSKKTKKPKKTKKSKKGLGDDIDFTASGDVVVGGARVSRHSARRMNQGINDDRFGDASKLEEALMIAEQLDMENKEISDDKKSKGKSKKKKLDPLQEVIKVYQAAMDTGGASHTVAKARARDKARQLGIDDKLEYYPNGTIMYREGTPDRKKVEKKLEDLTKDSIVLEATTVPDEGKKEVSKTELKDRVDKFIKRSETLTPQEKKEWGEKLKKSKNPKEIIRDLQDEDVPPPENILPIESRTGLPKLPPGLTEEEIERQFKQVGIDMKKGTLTTARGFIHEKIFDDDKKSSEQEKITGRDSQQILEPPISPALPEPKREAISAPKSSKKAKDLGEPAWGVIPGVDTRRKTQPYHMDPEFQKKLKDQSAKARVADDKTEPVLTYIRGKAAGGYKFVPIDRTLISKEDVGKLMQKLKGKDRITDPLVWDKFHNESMVPELVWKPIERGQSKLQKRKGSEPIPEPVVSDLKSALAKRREAIEKAERDAPKKARDAWKKSLKLQIAQTKDKKLKEDLKKILDKGPSKEDLTREAAMEGAEVRWVYKYVKDPKTKKTVVKRVAESGLHVYSGPKVGSTRPEIKPLSEGEKTLLALRRTAALENITAQMAMMQDAREADKLARKYIKKYTKKPARGFRPAQIERAWGRKEPKGRWRLRIRREGKHVYFNIVAPTKYKDKDGYTHTPFNTQADVESKVGQLLDLMNMRIAPGARIEQYRIPKVGKKHMVLKYKVEAVKL